MTRADRWLALCLFVGTVIVVGASAQSLGFTRDEGYYFKAGRLYAAWWQELVSQPLSALTTRSIDEHLSYNPEHPFLMKGSFALSWALNQAAGQPFLQHNALRFPAWIAAGLSTLFVFLLARQLLPRGPAVLAALCWISMPHVFWHMHLACFDVGVAAGYLAASEALARLDGPVTGLRRRRPGADIARRRRRPRERGSRSDGILGRARSGPRARRFGPAVGADRVGESKSP